MDSASNHLSTVSERYFSRIKRAALLLAFISLLILEIYICYYVTLTSHFDPGKINTSKFTCGENIDINNELHVNICNKLINIFKFSNKTDRRVTLTSNEWSSLANLLR
jgi:hypothetical protein